MPPTDVLIRDYSTARRALTRAAVIGLAGLWGSWSWDDALGVKEAAGAVFPGLVWAYQDAAAMLAADYYDAARADAAVGGSFRAVQAGLAAQAQLDAGIGFAISPLFSRTPDIGSAQSLLAGVATRLVTKAAADTIVGSSGADPKGVGWSRIARPGGCGFCRMLAGRGTVYRSDATASFSAHDWCGCEASPSWDPYSPRPVRAQFIASRRGKPSVADRERVREYIAEHYV